MGSPAGATLAWALRFRFECGVQLLVELGQGLGIGVDERNSRAPSAGAVDLYNMIIDCATSQCDTECADGTMSDPDAGTSAGGPDMGEPNDGNGGHPSTDRPPDCLFISPDVTGYCEEVKYKVIYDCANGAPYDDCELNKIGSSGVYCCGH